VDGGHDHPLWISRKRAGCRYSICSQAPRSYANVSAAAHRNRNGFGILERLRERDSRGLERALRNATHQTVQYRLQIVADNLSRHAGQVFEVSFDGICVEEMSEMKRHLVIRECS
jgi:hypothetical protein